MLKLKIILFNVYKILTITHIHIYIYKEQLSNLPKILLFEIIHYKL